MLRITCTDSDDGRVVLRLEGRLVGPWVDLLREECEAIHDQSGGPLIIEATHVHFADRHGLDLLRVLHHQGVARLTGSSFLQHLIGDA